MREIFILTKASLINNFNLHSLNPANFNQYNNKNDAKKVLLYFFVVIAMMPAYFLYVRLVRQIGFSFLMINQESYFLALAHYASVLMVFFLGLTYVLSYYYFSRDTDMLIPLPVSGKSIIISKFISLLVFEYFVLGIFIIPVIIINHGLVGGGLIYYLKAIILFLVTPVVPLSLASIIIITIMKFTNIKGKKDLIRVVSMFLFLFVFLGLQIVMQRAMMNIPFGNEQEFFSNLFTDNRYMIDMLGRFYPLSRWASLSLADNTSVALTGLASFLLTSATFFVMMVLFSEKMYLGGIIGGNEIQSKKKALSSEEFTKASSKVSSSFMAIFKVDLITLIKTPIYMFNCVSIVVLVPFIFLVMPALTGVTSDLDVFIGIYQSNVKLFAFGLAGAYMLFAALNPTASTTFSREGKTFYITRIIPVEARDHIIGKALSPILMQIFTIIVISIGIRFYIPLDLSTMLISGFLGFVASLPVILSGILVDINRPLLDWDNPQRAVKQNMNVIIAMAIGAIMALGIGFLTYLMININLATFIILLVDLIIIVALTYVVYNLVNKRITYQLANME
jgi:ABC-2 type transport system permease protein